MKFDIFCDDLAEELNQFLEGDLYYSYLEYNDEVADDEELSMAEYVEYFLKEEFKRYLEDMGYIFEESR